MEHGQLLQIMIQSTPIHQAGQIKQLQQQMVKYCHQLPLTISGHTTAIDSKTLVAYSKHHLKQQEHLVSQEVEQDAQMVMPSV